jgi:solute carrier family 35, member C2
LSNLSLVRISITFYTMVKASTPIFVLIWAYFLGIEKITMPLVLVVIVIAAGEFLTVTGEGGDLDVLGFAMCVMASFLSGARWTLVQLKLRTMEPPLKTTIATMRLLSPSMFASLFFISLAIEEPWNRLANSDAMELGKVLGLGLIGAVLAISMVLCEFWLIMRSNAIVLMIGGVLKEMVTIMIGVGYFHDKLNRVNITGCLIVFLGVILYKVSHYLEAQQRKLETNYIATRTDTGDEEEEDDNNDDNNGVLAMGDDSESPLTTNHGIDDDTLALRKTDSGYDGAASMLFKDGADGIFMHKPGSEGIELRRKHIVAQVHPPSPSNSNGSEAKAKLNLMVSLSSRDIV